MSGGAGKSGRGGTSLAIRPPLSRSATSRSWRAWRRSHQPALAAEMPGEPQRRVGRDSRACRR